jgi:hypothetical protein
MIKYIVISEINLAGDEVSELDLQELQAVVREMLKDSKMIIGIKITSVTGSVMKFEGGGVGKAESRKRKR